MAASSSKAESDALDTAPKLRLDVKSPSFTRPLAIDVDATRTVSQLKEQVANAARAARSAPHGWPQAHGIRCIYRGRILTDDALLSTLEAQDTPVSLHVVVQPEAWQPYEAPPPEEHGPAGSAPVAPPAPAHSWDTFLESLAPTDLVGVAHAIFLTHAAYTAYLAELQQTYPSAGPVRLRLPRVPCPKMLPEEAMQNEANLRDGAVAFVERHVMQWTPWSDVCVDARKAAPASVAHYEHLTLQGLPYLLCTHRAAPSLATLHAHAATLLERIEQLQDVWVALACRLTERERAPVPVPLEWITWADVRAMLSSVGLMALRLLFVYMVFLQHLGPTTTWLVAAASALLLVWHAYFLLHRRWRERVSPHASSESTNSQPAPLSVAVPGAEGSGALEIPCLPYRRAEGRWTQTTYWVQRLAWLGLEEEEAAIGFEHVPPETPPRIVWVATESYRTARPAPLRRPLWLRYVVLPAVLFLVTIIPPVDECRADALSLRKDAILALKKKWDEYREKPTTRTDARPPAILLHPYALALLAREARP